MATSKDLTLTGCRLGNPAMLALSATASSWIAGNGDTVDVNAIAQNARTSTGMVGRFYGSRLEGEMAIGKMQSEIRQKQTEKPKPLEGSEHITGWDRNMAQAIDRLQKNLYALQVVLLGNKVSIQ